MPSPDKPRWGRQSRPLVIAHRGASAERPENSLASFRLAEEQGADAVELDVMRCGSGEVVIFHDDDLKRLAGRPDRIRETPLATLREVPIEGAPMPTLEELFASVGPDLLINVELKSPDRRGLQYLETLKDDGLAREVAAIIRRFGMAERVLVSSFDPTLLLRFRRAMPEVATGLLFQSNMGRALRDAWAAPLLRPTALHPENLLVSPRAVDLWHRAGRAVNVWTVDAPHEIAFLTTIGCDGIITNRPAATRAAIDATLAAQAHAG